MKKSVFAKESKKIKLLTNATVLRVIDFLKQRPESTVNGIYRALKLEQSVTSTVLARLKKHNFVTFRKQGREKVYALNKYVIAQSLQSMIDDL